MKFSGLFNEIAAEINITCDRDITTIEEEALLAMANAIEEDPASAQTVLNELGQELDGFQLPAGVCILGLIKRIFGS